MLVHVTVTVIVLVLMLVAVRRAHLNVLVCVLVLVSCGDVLFLVNHVVMGHGRMFVLVFFLLFFVSMIAMSLVKLM